MEMRRSDRRVTDINEIFSILSRCDTITLGFSTDGAPYLVPMTFACALEEGQPVIYFHSAQGGRKWDLLASSPVISVEAHLYYTVVQENGGVTARYESVMGSGIPQLLAGSREKIDAFKLMLEHYKQSGFPAQSCKGLTKCEVFRLVLTEYSGKRNL